MAEQQVLMSVDFLRKVSSVIGRVQPFLEKQKQLSESVSKVAADVCDTLARQGLMSPHLKEAKCRGYSENPLLVLEDLKVAAGLVKAQSLGAPAGEPDGVPSGEESADDAFARIVMDGQE